jgi:CDP-glycerol glycerophosphotransferase (TagB/SpsB family)
LLSSADLHAAAEKLGCRIVLILHHRMLGTQREFGNLHNVQIFRWGEDGSVQDLLCRTAVAITDYSSIVFDAALAGADIVYYQFDSVTFFSGTHTCRPGFFDYKRDGLGPLCADSQQAGVVLRTISERGTGANRLFEGRKKAFFTFQDARNCERLLAQLASGAPLPA